MPRPILLDTDLGSAAEDALALALALAAHELEIVAITHAGREAATRARITGKLLALAGRPEIPVHAGCRVPLLGGTGFDWFGHEGEGILEPGEYVPVAEEHAVDALLRLSRARGGLEVVAIGPLTNLAVALVKDPDLAGRLSRITLAGGELGGQEGAVGGLFADPHASLVVLRSGIPATWVTGDATRVWLRSEDLRRLEALETPFHAALARAVGIWTPIQRRLLRARGVPLEDTHVAQLGDALAVASTYDGSFFRFEEIEMEPAIEEGVFRALERSETTDRSVPVRCAVEVDAERVRAHFLDRVSRFHPPGDRSTR